MAAVRYTRRYRYGDRGVDVEGTGRALCRSGHGIPLVVYNALPARVRRTWGRRKQEWLRSFKKKHGLAHDAIYGTGAHRVLSPYYDARARSYMERWEEPVPLVEPRQKWRSLDPTLHELYSIGRAKYRLSDLGTYNGASRLPGGGISDHARWPALAFDLGIDPDVGMSDPEGRAFFEFCVGRPEVEYVILGDVIWSRSGGRRRYTAGGHGNHAHVSGRRSRAIRLALRAKAAISRV